MITIDIGALYTDTAKLPELDRYKEVCLEQAGSGNDIVLTGRGPVWLYLVLAHALHGKAKRLYYRSPVTVMSWSLIMIRLGNQKSRKRRGFKHE